MLYLDDIKSAPASSKVSTTRSATVTVMMTSSYLDPLSISSVRSPSHKNRDEPFILYCDLNK